MWWVRPATMTRRIERLSRLLRLWLTTMPSDFTTFPRLLRLSPERLCDFPARVSDFDRAADLPTGSAAFLFPHLIGGGFHRGGVGAARVPARSGRRFSPFICIVHFLLSFRTVESIKKKLELFLETLLTFKLKLDILQSSS